MYLTESNIFKLYQDAKQYTDQLTLPFFEYQRIARNEPYEASNPNYPDVTDGTTASIIQKTPKRVVQQLPTGKVITDDEGWLGIVADYIYNNKIIPYANQDFSLYEKAQLIIESGLTFGFGLSYAPFINHEGYFCPDMTLPYWGDIMLQKGKKSGKSSDYIFIRSWWQPEDIENLISGEQDRADKATEEKRTYDSTWDIAALKEVKAVTDAKDRQATTPSEKDRGLDKTAIELVTGFQKGVKASFFTFNPDHKKIVRTKINKDPRGVMPLDWFFGDIDGTNPFGRGIVEVIGPLQNLIDSDMQAYQYNRALALQPPVVKYGNIGKFSFEPNFVVDARDDPNAKVVPLVVDTSALTNYPALYGLQKSQILNLVNSPDTSISADAGNPSFSKTPQGVKSQQAVVSVDDNTVRKRFESWFQAWSETAINLYFGERTGTEEIQLDKSTAMKLRELPNFDQKKLSKDNKILINYDSDTPALKFKVDPSTTAVADKTAQVQDATNLLDLVMKYPMLNANFGGPIDVDTLARRIVVNSGIDDPEQVAPEPTEAQKKSKEEQKNRVSPFSPMFDKPSIRMDYLDLPPAAQLQLLASAGIQVTPQDIMQGPILDPNARGNVDLNPVNDPNILLPGQQPGQQNTPAPAPIDFGDIYKQTTDPSVRAQIEAMAGLSPDQTHVANQMQTNMTDNMAQQVGHANTVATALNPPPPPQPATPAPKAPKQQKSQLPQLTPEDLKLIANLKQLGVPDDIIQQVIDDFNNGMTAQQVIQQLQGASNG